MKTLKNNMDCSQNMYYALSIFGYTFLLTSILEDDVTIF
jgi:hypothetical protein